MEPLARAAAIRHMDRGEYVHHVGDPADEVFIVASGRLKDSIVTEDGDELVHSFFGTRTVIGEPGFNSVLGDSEPHRGAATGLMIYRARSETGA